MCKFCDNLEYKTITVPTRTSMADHNICEDIQCGSCSGCSEENNYFSIATWDDNIDISYYNKIKDVVVAPVSTRFSINFCPMCGKRISKDFYYEDLKFW